MRVADRFSDGRVFLAGDAAHVMPPWAAAGANTGIADIANLGWKLAAVLHGEAAPALLASYDVERRPVATAVAEESVRRMRDPGGTGGVHPLVLATGGLQYQLDGVTEQEPVTEFAPAGRVGVRVPHARLADGRSTLDLAGPGWALLVAGGGTWESDVPVHRVEVPWLADGEAVLVRPDRVVAWRGTDHTAPPRIRAALLGAGARTVVAAKPLSRKKLA